MYVFNELIVQNNSKTFFNDLHTCTFYTNLNRAHARVPVYSIAPNFYAYVVHVPHHQPHNQAQAPIPACCAERVRDSQRRTRPHGGTYTDKHGHAAASRPTQSYVLNERLQVYK